MTATLTPEVDVRRADERHKTRLGWLDSKHSFSFSRHHDPANTHHGLLLVNNDDTVRPGTGFETHPHQDMEIVTWVQCASPPPEASASPRPSRPRSWSGRCTPLWAESASTDAKRGVLAARC